MVLRIRRVLAVSWLCMLAATAQASPLPSVYLEDLTSREVASAVAAGMTTVIVPIGGTEQSGPAIVLGKHNRRAHILAARIAERLGDALVAPVIAYVPEGSIEPPAEHMRFAGTVSITPSTFEQLLESTARSLRAHGFREIVFIGDHGGYQENLRQVARQLNAAWAATPVRVLACSEYYNAAAHEYPRWLAQQGYSNAQIGSHAGLADAALSLAIDPSAVRGDILHQQEPGVAEGVHGDARAATAALGAPGIELIIDRSVAAIRKAALRP